jgi:hypothetical protein
MTIPPILVPMRSRRSRRTLQSVKVGLMQSSIGRHSLAY